MLSIVPGSSALANAPAVALVLAVAALIGGQGQEARRQRLMAGVALGNQGWARKNARPWLKALRSTTG